MYAFWTGGASGWLQLPQAGGHSRYVGWTNTWSVGPSVGPSVCGSVGSRLARCTFAFQINQRPPSEGGGELEPSWNKRTSAKYIHPLSSETCSRFRARVSGLRAGSRTEALYRLSRRHVYCITIHAPFQGTFKEAGDAAARRPTFQGFRKFPPDHSDAALGAKYAREREGAVGGR